MKYILLIITGITLVVCGLSQEVSQLTLFEKVSSDYFVIKSMKKDSVETIKPYYYQMHPDSFYSEGVENLSDSLDFFFSPDVKYYLQQYLKKENIKNLTYCISRYNYYKPELLKLADKYKIPHEITVLPMILSYGDVFAVQPSMGSGFWQLSYIYARQNGLKIDSLFDERRDFEKSTHAAFKYLNNLHKEYNNWTMTLAAYCCGPANVNRAIIRSEKTDFQSIYEYLPKDNKKLIPAFYAMSFILNYQDTLGIESYPIHFPVSGDTIFLKDSVHFMQIVDITKVPIEELRFLNPEYYRDFVPVKKDSIKLILPDGYVSLFMENEDKIYNDKDSVYFSMIMPKYIATSANLTVIPGSETYKPVKPSGNYKEVYYTIKKGDNLGFISDWFDCSVNDIQYWNGLFSTRITAGKELVIFVPKDKVAYYKKLNALSFEQKQRLAGNAVSENQIKHNDTKHEKVSPEIFKKGKWVNYEVKSGDSPYKIAKKYHGVSDQNIMDWNGITDPSKLKIGQKLKIKISD